ncbi:FAD-dependent oxidoreductase [Mycolicibacterium brumae]|uniref:FAD-binding domain-containing protein n=1 Tax=Mycolicibacterium brumae TaxID=85968 RepID=A0A2G5PDI6_9MYCO|nr:FAD-dependent oxidoreductase [Mycolicibacterium brumae]MCV7193577.1 FAD-dependent oxidoreductase [Mycolicibacterium brumae]PIB76150.1 hypothetical protein CQY22_007165 [Mycolicibacterium brumae]RWA17276.1 hypothetical protein MBRU_06540 [Mycolicibacterium brumae DSM 44177]UWW09150.1 FAD-dependent oxidoreductase [Mycolicibacterium brumae]
MTERTTCAVVGGGPAGMMLGLILARCGVDVTVFEKHADFLRDFRGDTVHPSTLTLLDELGLFEQFDALPHSRLERVELPIGDTVVTPVDFSRLPVAHPYIAMAPQWDFLNLLAKAGENEPHFTLRMSTEVTGLLKDGSTVIGVRYRGPDGDGELRADLTVACDGRSSLLRAAAGLTPRSYPVPFDVWWFRLPRADEADYSLLPRTMPGRAIIMIPRVGYFQIAYLIPKGADAQLRARGLDSLRAELSVLAPECDAASIDDWDDVKLLNVQLNELPRWYGDGLLCIGDAAHAMSPAGGVGVNLAIQDAVAAAGLLWRPLRDGTVGEADLAAVQRRRGLQTRAVQFVQRMIHRVLLKPVLAGRDITAPNPAIRLGAAVLRRFPAIAGIPARVVGLGLRPEHVPEPARR